MFQAPLLGFMVDSAIIQNTNEALLTLEGEFRIIILCAFFGALFGAFLTPTMAYLFKKAIEIFQVTGSIPKLVFIALKPRYLKKIICAFRIPRISSLKTITFKSLPKGFLIFNVFVTSIYVIGVLFSIAGAYLPEYRSTAIQLSGIVNGMATIMFTIFVDPPE